MKNKAARGINIPGNDAHSNDAHSNDARNNDIHGNGAKSKTALKGRDADTGCDSGLSGLFNAAVATGATVTGAAIALACGLSPGGIAAAAAGAAAGTTAASLLVRKSAAAAFDGRGPEAGIAGIFFLAAGHVTAVPAAGVAAAYGVLKLTGFVP